MILSSFVFEGSNMYARMKQLSIKNHSMQPRYYPLHLVT